MIVRRRWALILTIPLVVFGTLVVLSRIPNRYSSEATLLVVQQQIPQRYVLPTSTTDLRDALQATTQEVLSRARLLQIIDEFGLYSRYRKLAPESLLEMVRRDIDIQPVESQSSQRDINSFKISFIGTNPRLAQEVTSKLTSLFIEQNLATREHQATTTTTFLHDHLESVKEKLNDAEAQVGRFKMQNLGELPEQQAGNLAILGGLQTQLQNNSASLNRAYEQQQYLQSLIEYRASALDANLAKLKSTRADLLSKYTAKHPEVVKINETIARTENLLKTLREPTARAVAAAQTEPHPTSSDANEDISLVQLRSQQERNRLEIENLSKEQERLKTSISQYQVRLNQTPVREQQLTGMMRNYNQLKQDYSDLLSKEMQSQQAADLEKRQEGQQFRVIDPPSLPSTPLSPNRIKISLGGVGAGIALGLALMVLMEMRDRSFRSEGDLSQAIGAPFVFGLPEMPTPREQQHDSLRKKFEWLTATTLGLAVLVAEVYEYYLYRHV